MHRIEIIPAILPKTVDDLRAHLERVRGVAKLVQIDIVGKNILEGQEEMPFWEEFDFEFDLMVEHPERVFHDFINLGASRIVVHAKNAGALEALKQLQEFRSGDYPVAVGIALASNDVPAALAPFEGLYDFVQVMGIEKIGFQGQPFDEHSIAFVSALRAQYPELQIQVDGGVKLENANALARAGASRLIAGSAIFESGDPAATLKALYTRANGSD